MSFFNFVETFFFISLAITFVLIMMLVYHFKERLSTLEKKSNTIVDIINNIVKELTIIKHQAITSGSIVPSHPSNNDNIIITQREITSISLENSESHAESESETESESDSDLDLESDDDDSTIYEVEPTDYQDLANSNEHDIQEKEPEYDNDNIKRININLSSNTPNDVLEDLGDIPELISDDVEDQPDEIEINENEEPILINKLDEPALILEEVSPINQSDNEIYRKMEVSSLRALVISKGLASDTKKMKKHDLIRLLESAQD